MAKKGTRVKIGLVCQNCQRFNYVSEKNKLSTPDSLKLKKYCPHCRKRTNHKEKKKL